MTLSSAQIQEFKDTGVLVLRGFFSDAEVRSWRAEILDYFDHPATGDDWRAALRRVRADDFQIAEDPTPLRHERTRSLYGALDRRAAWIGENELLVRPGGDEPPWSGARAPHLDYPTATPVKTLANTTFYLTDVATEGGAFLYWPGSHHLAWRHHRREPDDYLARGARSQDQTFALLLQEMTGPPVAFTGRAGDLLLWHAFILHSASTNIRAETRLAMIGRWGVARTGYAPWDFQADIWSDWNFQPSGDA